MRKIALVSLLLGMIAAANAEKMVRPEVVQLENTFVEGEMRTVYVGNADNHYLLYCNTKASGGCITPEDNKNYFLFDANTRWTLPGAKTPLTLGFIQEMTVTYDKGENVGLYAEGGGGDLGLFIRDPTGGGYEQYIIFSDGPINYGVGLSDEDRQKAWQAFFLKMLQAVSEQQGKEALGTKLARRCMPGQEYCTTILSANMVGIGGVKEPREVRLLVTTDVHDQNKQLARLVCTYPSKGSSVCREWDTGKLVSVKHPEQN